MTKVLTDVLLRMVQQNCDNNGVCLAPGLDALFIAWTEFSCHRTPDEPKPSVEEFTRRLDKNIAVYRERMILQFERNDHAHVH